MITNQPFSRPISSNGAMPWIGLVEGVWFYRGMKVELHLGVWHVTLYGASYSTRT